MLDGVDAGVDGEVFEVRGVTWRCFSAYSVEDGEVAVGVEGLLGQSSWNAGGEAETFGIGRGKIWKGCRDAVGAVVEVFGCGRLIARF